MHNSYVENAFDYIQDIRYILYISKRDDDMTKLVTAESLNALLQNPRIRAHVIGRACVALMKRQTAAEKQQLTTNVDNGIGFTGADAKSGTLTAFAYIKHNTLCDWQIDKWMKPNSKGQPRIVKYWRQLNEEAEVKQK